MKTIKAVTAVSQAWQVFKKDPLRHIGVFLLALLIYFILTMFWPAGINTVVNILLAPALALFLYGYALDSVREEYEDLGSTFKKYLTANKYVQGLLAYLAILIIAGILISPILYNMYKNIAILPAQNPQALQNMHFSSPSGTMALLGIIGMALFIYISLRLLFTYFFIADKDYSFVDAFKASWEATKSHVWELFILFLIVVGLTMLGVLAFGVGLIIVLPIIYLSYAVFYNAVTGEEEVADEIIEAE